MSKYERIKLIVLGAVILGVFYLLWGFSNNGRYFFVSDENMLLDTRTGEMYFLRDRNKLNPGDFKGKKEKESFEVIF